jgi:5-methylcytosine-specific restriction endonuclease McrBC regulatory subunit McrC
MSHKFVTDNNYPLEDISNWNDVTINSLKKIGNKSAIDLQKENDNLLIFPKNFKEYGDDIGKSHIFNIYSDNKLQTHNLMGFIGIDNVQLTIGSRFDDDKNKQYFLQYMLHKVFAINMVDLNTKADNENIWDFLLMFMFPYFLNNALRQGVYKEYQKKKNNDFNVKGTIDIARHIKRNIPFMGKVAYNTREFSYDNSTTQLIRHTAEYIIQKGFSNALNPNSETIENVNIIRKATPDYNIRDRQKVISKNYKKVKHPFFTEYEPLRNICMRILRHEGVSMENSENKVHGLLFDGAWLWEEYLNTILKDCDFEHPENKTKKNGLLLPKLSDSA